MGDDELRRSLAGLGRRPVVVVSDRYPPDVGGGAEVSLNLLLREAPLRDRCLVVTFDKALDAPLRRSFEGVEILSLPAGAAWPLHRLSQQQVERLKRRPFGLKWAAFLREAVAALLRSPRLHGPAIAALLAGPPSGGVRMEHATTPEGGAVRDLRLVFEILRPDLVHADNAASIIAAAEALGGTATPLVALVRDHRFTSPRFDQREEVAPSRLGERLAAGCAGKALAYRQSRLARAVVAIATSRHVAGTLGGVVAPGRLLRLPLEPVALPERAERREGGGFSILVVGSLTENKGQAHLLEAWPQIRDRIPGARIDVAGQGPDRAAIEALVARHGAGDRIRLHGHVAGEALADLYRACDVVALPTLWAEPFGRVPLEAGAAFRPVVAYASGGHAETVEDGVNGRLVPRGDREAFVEALADLAAAPEARARMSEAGRKRAAEDHDPATLSRLLGRLWDENAAGPTAGPTPALRRASSAGG